MASVEELERSGGWTEPGGMGTRDRARGRMSRWVGDVRSPQGCQLWLRGVAKFSLMLGHVSLWRVTGGGRGRGMWSGNWAGGHAETFPMLVAIAQQLAAVVTRWARRDVQPTSTSATATSSPLSLARSAWAIIRCGGSPSVTTVPASHGGEALVVRISRFSASEVSDDRRESVSGPLGRSAADPARWRPPRPPDRGGPGGAGYSSADSPAPETASYADASNSNFPLSSRPTSRSA